MKKCYACGLDKPQEEFRKARSDTGYSAKCSRCWRDEAAAAAVRRREERRLQVIAAGGKVCCRCNERKSPELFATRLASADGLESFCIDCNRARWRERRKDPGIRLEHRSKAKRHYWKDPEKARARARAYNAQRAPNAYRLAHERWRETRWAERMIPSLNRYRIVSKFGPTALTAKELRSLFEQQGGRCYWLGIPMVPSRLKRDPRRPSIDRLDNNRGYVQGNVVLTCQFANMGRSQLDAESFRAFIAELKQHMCR